MGIERFFNSVRTSSKLRVVHDIARAEVFHGVEVLLCDFNAMIHNVSAALSHNLVQQAAEKAAKEGGIVSQVGEDIDSMVISEVVAHTAALTARFPDCTCVGIFIDGVPNYGKVVTQYSRRTIGDMVRYGRKVLLEAYRHELDTEPGPSVPFNQYRFELAVQGLRFDKNKISPGTAFMDRMQNALRDKVTVFSGYEEDGEGEMKLIRFLRTVPNKNIMVYSPDADVILLLLLEVSKGRQLSIFRSVDAKAHRIDVSGLHKLIADECGRPDRIKDVVVLFSIFGNDFIPKLVNDNSTEQIEEVLRAYKEAANSYPGRSVLLPQSKRTLVDWQFLGEVIRRCADVVDRQTRHKRFVRRWDPGTTLVNPKAVRFLTHLHDLENLQGRYTPPAKRSADIISDDVHLSYCEGIQWIVTYYIDHMDCKHRKWFYPHHAKPTLSSLTSYVIRHGDRLSKMVQAGLSSATPVPYLDPLTQLMYISPGDIRGLVDIDKLNSEQVASIGTYSAQHGIVWSNVLRYDKAKDRLNIWAVLDCSTSRFLGQCHLRKSVPLPLEDFLHRYGQVRDSQIRLYSGQ